MVQLAKDTGLTREGLYKALGNLCHGGVEITKLGNLNRPAFPRACHLIAVTLRYTLRQGKQVVIPSRRCCKEKRPYDKHLYKAPHLIENFFARLKQYRCIATRYDKTADAFLGGIHLAAIAIWLN